MIRHRRTRIVATLGPASRTPEQVEALARAGADVFRLNFSHGRHEDHRAAFDAVRAAEFVVDRPLAVLADLQGPKLRLGVFEDGGVSLAEGQAFRLDLAPTPGGPTRAPMPHPEIFRALRAGSPLLLDDGRVRLRVVEAGPDFAETVVERGERLSDRKGVAVPGGVIPMSALTPKDLTDLAYALRLGVDWIALSFVQRAADMAELRRIVEGRAAVLAKIEKPAALEALDEILDLCDGVMVARGDLGVELDPEDVPVVQKRLLREARDRGIPAIVATQMLESMISAATPTRAEASDVANAVYEGADAVMLSAETAAGSYPLEAVSVMDRIISRVERDAHWPSLMAAEHPALHEEQADALVAAASTAAHTARASAVVVFTVRGETARRLARTRPLQPVLALAEEPAVARRLGLVWGVEARIADRPMDLEGMTRTALEAARGLGLAPSGRRVLVLAGAGYDSPGVSDVLRLAYA
jgi:pyruvate kinase